MRWLTRTGAATLVAALVVLMPVGMETPASALGSVVPPVDPYPVMPSTVIKGGGAGVLDGTKSWAQAWAEVQKSSVAAGKPVASPITQAETIVRNAQASSNANVLLKGFVGGFTIGSLGVGAFQALTGITALPVNCGNEFEKIGASVLYPTISSACTVSYEETELNADVSVVPPGWSATPVVMFPAGAYGAWGTWASASSRIESLSGPVLPSMNGLFTSSFASTYNGSWGTSVTYQPSLRSPLILQRRNAAGSWEDAVTLGLNVGTGGKMRTGPQWLTTPDTLLTTATYQMSNFASGGYTQYRVALQKPDGTAAAYWYPEGYPDRPAGQSGDPLRTAKCRVTMEDGSVREGFIGQYRETEGFPVGAIAAACTDAAGNSVAQGLLPETIEITSTNNDTGKTDTISTQTVPDFTETEKVGLTPGDNTGLRLLKVVNGSLQSCMTWEAACVNWWTKTSSGTVTTTDEGEYRCEYGGRTVPLAECGVYRNTFDVQTETPTVTDPVTGSQTNWSSSPDPANQFGTGNQSGQSNDRCVTSFSWNPVDWVLRPIRCAFEPSKNKLDQVKARLNAAWLSSGVGALGVTLGGFVSAFNAAEGCAGLPLHLEGFGVTLVDTRLLAACEEPARGIAATVRAVLTVGILGGGLFATIRYLAALFGFTGYGKTGAGGGSSRGVHFE